MLYFSNVFGVNKHALDQYGAFNISLLNDLPLFIDPFLLYASKKPEYQKLHNDIVKYLQLLNQIARSGLCRKWMKQHLFSFPEVKQVWLGYSKTSNRGSGLGNKFAESMLRVMSTYDMTGSSTIAETTHLEKFCLFNEGIGKDNISDFACNLIKGYLLEYTESFARQYIDSSKLKKVSVSKAYFDYKHMVWRSKVYLLPYYRKDYVILVPKDLLTKDECWLNFNDMKDKFLTVIDSVPNNELRGKLNDLYLSLLPQDAKSDDIRNAVEKMIRRHPDILDYYIKLRESEKELAKSNAESVVDEAYTCFVRNVCSFVKRNLEHKFYTDAFENTLEATRSRVLFLKDIIENKDGYRLFYVDGKVVKRESDLQLLFKFVWFGSGLDVNAEVNNGRGPVDFKISNGSNDCSLVEFKLASNSKLRQNLMHQVGVYERANNTKQSIKVIAYFSAKDYDRVIGILNDLKLEKDPNIILIDICDDKTSASNVK